MGRATGARGASGPEGRSERRAQGLTKALLGTKPPLVTRALCCGGDEGPTTGVTNQLEEGRGLPQGPGTGAGRAPTCRWT